MRVLANVQTPAILCPMHLEPMKAQLLETDKWFLAHITCMTRHSTVNIWLSITAMANVGNPESRKALDFSFKELGVGFGIVEPILKTTTSNVVEFIAEGQPPQILQNLTWPSPSHSRVKGTIANQI
jgi:hypothetical protein